MDTAAAATVRVFDHGFLYGDGIFETMRLYRGTPFRLCAHLERLARGAATLELPHPPSTAALTAAVADTIKQAQLDDGQLRITVTRGEWPGTFDPSACKQSTVVIAALPLAIRRQSHAAGLTVVTVGARNPNSDPPPTVKSTSFQGAVLGRLRAQQAGADEGLWTDADTNVTESTTANVFAVISGCLRTPPAKVCLPGITRQVVLDLATETDLDVVVAPLSLDDLVQADEAFLTSSLAEIVPIRSIDGASIGSCVPGPWTERLTNTYRQQVLKETI